METYTKEDHEVDEKSTWSQNKIDSPHHRGLKPLSNAEMKCSYDDDKSLSQTFRSN
jgi:hypothetical protein